jgi:G:T-mismatch repair DNA endonuclease (very short patch repair protein)
MNSLKQLGWKVGIIWECETESPNVVEKKLRKFLKEL